MKNTNPHKIITLTGPDRVGKSTQVQLLNKALCPSVVMKFPNPNHWTEPILRAILADEEFYVFRSSPLWDAPPCKQEKDPTIFQMINSINRKAFQGEIKENLKTSHIIMDRYDIDPLLYGVPEGVDLQLALELMRDDIESDLVLILHGKGFGGAQLWLDNNDSNIGLQTRVIKMGAALSTLYPDRVNLMDVDEFKGSISTVQDIWTVHNRICELINYRLNFRIQSLPYVRVEEILKENGTKR